MKEFKNFLNSVRKSASNIPENTDCQFRAIFVAGAPGSGKDVIVRSLVTGGNLAELNHTQAIDILGDKQKLSEESGDFRREVIRNRESLIINGPSDDKERILHIKEELEELGYSTMMVFVNTTNEVSQERNQQLVRVMAEGVRAAKWQKSQINLTIFDEQFTRLIEFDNNFDLSSSGKYITEALSAIEKFLLSNKLDEIAVDWLKKNRKPLRKLHDNNSPFMQMQAKSGKIDKVTDGDIKSNGGYTFRAYHENKEPILHINGEKKETKFSMDNDKEKNKKARNTAVPSTGKINAPGVGAQYDTRRQGSVMPLGGLGESKDFGSFRKLVKTESHNDPGGVEMGTFNGSPNKDGLEVLQDKTGQDGPKIKNKKKVSK